MNPMLLISLIFGGIPILQIEAWQSSVGFSLNTRPGLSKRQRMHTDFPTFASSSSSSLSAQSSKQSDSKHQFQQPKHSSKQQSGSKFGQPRFAQANNDNSNNNPNAQKKHKKDPNKFGADSRIASRHAERLKTAGREGTKRYQDPNKVFLGNLNFTVTDQDLQQFLSDEFALPGPLLLKQCKVVRDWKTQESKGYGFAVFSEPIYATVCLEKLNGKSYRGRSLRVEPGYKAAPDPQIYIEQKRQKRLAREAAGLLDEVEEEEEPMMDPMEALMLRKLDPDLVDEDRVLSWDADDEEEGPQGLVEVESYDDDDELFDEFDPDDDESGIDGYWFGDEEEESDIVEFDGTESLKNRQQRRQESRKKKKKKLSDKGFG